MVKQSSRSSDTWRSDNIAQRCNALRTPRIRVRSSNGHALKKHSRSADVNVMTTPHMIHTSVTTPHMIHLLRKNFDSNATTQPSLRHALLLALPHTPFTPHTSSTPFHSLHPPHFLTLPPLPSLPTLPPLPRSLPRATPTSRIS